MLLIMDTLKGWPKMDEQEKNGIIFALQKMIDRINAGNIEVLEIVNDVRLTPIYDGDFALGYRDIYKILTIKYRDAV